MHPGTAVAPVRLRVDDANPGEERLVLFHPLGERAGTPCVVPGPRHLQHPTHRGDVKDASVRLDELKPHRSSLAKKAVAFFKMSRSSLRRSFSRRSRRFSSSSNTRVGVAKPARWRAAVRHQLRRLCGCTPRSFATCTASPFPFSTRRTASRRNSSLYAVRPRFFFMTTSCLESQSWHLRCPLNPGKFNRSVARTTSLEFLVEKLD